MNYVYHRNKPPYGDTTTIITEDASAYVMITRFNSTAKDTAVIHDLVVLKERRGEGLGSALLEEAVAEAGRIGATKVRLSTEPDSWLEEWYMRHGFQETGEVEDLGHKFNVLERKI